MASATLLAWMHVFIPRLLRLFGRNSIRLWIGFALRLRLGSVFPGHRLSFHTASHAAIAVMVCCSLAEAHHSAAGTAPPIASAQSCDRKRVWWGKSVYVLFESGVSHCSKNI